MFKHLVEGDGEFAEKHRDFYDEYLSVMDMDREFYLQTVDTVFVNARAAQGRDDASRPAGRSHGDPRSRIMAVEGENDDISGIGQTHAALDLTTNLPAERSLPSPEDVGHYGVFNGSRFRSEIAPRISDFILSLDMEGPRSAGNADFAPR